MSSTPFDKTKDVNLKKLIKIEAEKESKRRAGEMNEVIEAIGQDSTQKALGPLREKLNHEQRVKENQENQKLEQLEDKAKFAKKSVIHDPYRRFLCELIIARIKEEKWPKGYHFKALPTDDGVALLLMTPRRKIYGHGFKPTHLNTYDLNAVEVLVMQLENRVEQLENGIRTSPKQV